MNSNNDTQLLNKYQKAVAEAQMGLWEWDLATNILRIDKGIQILYGYTSSVSELPFNDWVNSIHPDDLPAALSYGLKAQTNEFQKESLFRFVALDKKIKYVRSRAQQVRNDKGQVVSLIGLSWDVTAEMLMKQEKDLSETQFKTMISLIDSSADLFSFSDQKGVPLYVNKAGEDIYGIKEGQGHFLSYLAQKDLKYAQDVILPQLRANKGWEGELTIYKAETKEEIPVWVRIFSIRKGPNHNDLVYACNGSDLRKLKTIQKSLIVQSKMAALGEMAAEMAHEINNPLMIIQAKAQMMQERLVKGLVDIDKLVADLKLIEKNSQRIQKIVHSSKAISRNAEQDPYTPVSVLTLLDEALEIFEERFTKRNLQLQLIVQEGITHADVIEARGSEILQVFVNLINNAYDAIRTQPNGRVQIKISKVNGLYEIHVEDSGEKIKKEIAEKMMEPFFTTKPTGQGTGLGLSLSKQIIENHKGQLFYDPSAEQTCFVVRLQKKIY